MEFKHYGILVAVLFSVATIHLSLVFRVENPTMGELQPSPAEDSCIGFLIGNPNEEAETAAMTGAGWARPHPGPFVWGYVEPEPGRFVFMGTDDWVRELQKNGLAILATIWPYAGWDQNRCRGTGCEVSAEDEFYPESAPPGPPSGIPVSRCAPCNLDHYRAFVSEVVERYDGDGVNDMPGLEMPVRHWEVLNEPEMAGPDLTFFMGSPEEYAEILNVSHKAIKAACPGCKVVQGGAQNSMPNTLEWWERVFDSKGGRCFDIANVHYIDEGDLRTLNVRGFKELMQRKNISKPVWVTEAQYSSEEEVKWSFEGALGAGASKVFFTQFEVGRFGVPEPGRHSSVYEDLQCNQNNAVQNEALK